MKKHSLLVEIITFFVIFTCFIVVPIASQFFTTKESLFSQWSFPFENLLTFIVAFMIYSFFSERKTHEQVFFKIITPALFCFCLLFFISLLIKIFSIYFVNRFPSSEITVSLPSSFSTWTFCLLQFLFASYFEEVIFRFYLPESLIQFASNSKHKMLFSVLIEIFTLLCFSAAHIYLGFFAVINAFIAHIILRTTYKHTNSLLPVFIAHFFYNIISLILL